MKVKDIYNLALQMSIAADLRGADFVENLLQRRKDKYEKLSDKQKEEFDKDTLSNPYSDSLILNVAEDKEIKKVLFGIDIESAEILLAKELGNIDLIIAHHPRGKGLANLADVMNLQCDVLAKYGVPINEQSKCKFPPINGPLALPFSHSSQSVKGLIIPGDLS